MNRITGPADVLWKTSSADLAQLLNVAPAQVLKEVVFFKFTTPKGYRQHHRTNNNNYNHQLNNDSKSQFLINE